jgi:histidinol dehydrogenase
MTPLIRRFSSQNADFSTQLDALLHLEQQDDRAIRNTVLDIIHAVRQDGDAAVLRYTQQFDGVAATAVSALEISHDELAAAFNGLPAEQRNALTVAAQRIRTFHDHQIQASWQFTDEYGSTLGQRITPLDRVGLYVPGGKASYPSSVLMNAIPAKVAGVSELIMVVPTPQGVRNPMVLAAAHLAGVDRVFTIGGAQAVAALAYGTATIPRVDKIVGPGNAYVAAAKREVFGQVGIDMIAGPSEILILADATVNPDWIALDLFSQAEHDELAQSILVTPDATFADAVYSAIERLLPTQPRAAIIQTSLRNRGAIIVVRDADEACALANQIAAEHLEIATADPHTWAANIRHAGALFLGSYASESLGDYCAGPNHVLPTSGTARFSSPLGVYDFQKRSSMLDITPRGATVLGRIAETLALSEHLTAHAQSASARIQTQHESQLKGHAE